eukprot:561436-Alexandrium_andersonii.AAC.1
MRGMSRADDFWVCAHLGVDGSYTWGAKFCVVLVRAMYGHTIPFVDPARAGELVKDDDIAQLSDAQGEDWAPFV